MASSRSARCVRRQVLQPVRISVWLRRFIGRLYPFTDSFPQVGRAVPAIYFDFLIRHYPCSVIGKISPAGTFDNSPAIYRWETCPYIILVPQGRLKTEYPFTDSFFH